LRVARRFTKGAKIVEWGAEKWRCDGSFWSFRDVGREFNGDGRKRVINSRVSGISAIGFNFLKDLTIRTLLSIDVEVIMKYE